MKKITIAIALFLGMHLTMQAQNIQPADAVNHIRRNCNSLW
jgi:hypothetical protein